MNLDVRKLSNKEKAALMMLCMDESSASDIFSQLRDDEVKEIGRILQKLSNVPLAEVHAAMIEFHTELGNVDVLRNNSVQVSGSRAAERLISEYYPEAETKVIEMPNKNSAEGALTHIVNSMNEKALFQAIKDEHVQFIAIVLSFAKMRLAKEVLKQMEDEKSGDIIARMAKLSEIPQTVISQIKDFLDKQRAEVSKGLKKEEKKVSIEGMSCALRVLKSIPVDQSVPIIDTIIKQDEALGSEIEKQMLTIEDLMRSDDQGIRELLRSIPTEDLKVALKDMPDTVKDKFLNNMSSRAATILREDMEVMQALRVEEVERSQRVIITEVKRLISEGKLVLSSLDEE